MVIDYENLTNANWHSLESYMQSKSDYYLAKYGKYNLPDEIENMKLCENLIGILHNIEIGNTLIEGLNK